MSNMNINSDERKERIQEIIASLNLKNAVVGGYDKKSVEEALHDTIGVFLTEYDDLKKQNTKLQKQALSAQKKGLPEETERLEALNRENAELKEKVEALEAQLLQAQTQAASAPEPAVSEEADADLRTVMEALQKELSEKDEASQNAAAKIDEIQKALEDVHSEKDRTEAENSFMREQTEQLKAELEKTKLQLAEMQAIEAERNMEAAKAAEDYLQAITAERTALDASVTEVKECKTELSDRLDKTNNVLSSLLENLKNPDTAQDEAVSERVSLLCRQIEQLLENNRDMQARNDDTMQKITEQYKQIYDLSALEEEKIAKGKEATEEYLKAITDGKKALENVIAESAEKEAKLSACLDETNAELKAFLESIREHHEADDTSVSAQISALSEKISQLNDNDSNAQKQNETAMNEIAAQYKKIVGYMQDEKRIQEEQPQRAAAELQSVIKQTVAAVLNKDEKTAEFTLAALAQEDKDVICEIAAQCKQIIANQQDEKRIQKEQSQYTVSELRSVIEQTVTAMLNKDEKTAEFALAALAQEDKDAIREIAAQCEQIIANQQDEKRIQEEQSQRAAAELQSVIKQTVAAVLNKDEKTAEFALAALAQEDKDAIRQIAAQCQRIIAYQQDEKQLVMNKSRCAAEDLRKGMDEILALLQEKSAAMPMSLIANEDEAEERYKSFGDIYYKAQRHHDEIVQRAYADASDIMLHKQQEADRYRQKVEEEIAEQQRRFDLEQAEKQRRFEAEQAEKQRQFEAEQAEKQKECQAALNEANKESKELVQSARDKAEALINDALLESKRMRQDAENAAKKTQEEADQLLAGAMEKIQVGRSEMEETLRKMNEIMKGLPT